jgi:hypothetical protein
MPAAVSRLRGDFRFKAFYWSLFILCRLKCVHLGRFVYLIKTRFPASDGIALEAETRKVSEPASNFATMY